MTSKKGHLVLMLVGGQDSPDSVPPQVTGHSPLMDRCVHMTSILKPSRELDHCAMDQDSDPLRGSPVKVLEHC